MGSRWTDAIGPGTFLLSKPKGRPGEKRFTRGGQTVLVEERIERMFDYDLAKGRRLDGKNAGFRVTLTLAPHLQVRWKLSSAG